MLAGGAGSQSNGQGRWCWEAVLVHSLMVRGGRAGGWCYFTVLWSGEVVLGGCSSSQSNGQGRWCWEVVLVHSLIVRGGRAGR